ncbi:MAG: glutamine synthetase, partial [Leisingera sp.]
LAADWETAISWFETDPLIARILPKDAIRNLVMTKRQELQQFAERPGESHWLSWLEAV